MGRAGESRFTLAEWAAIWAVVLVWGVNNGAAKYATAYMPPMLVGGVRFAIALVFLAPFIRPPFPDWRKLLPVILLTGPMHYAVLYAAFGWAHNLSLLGIVLQLWIPLSALFAWLLLGEAMSPVAMAGIAAAFLGAGVMTFDPASRADVLPACLAGVAGVFWALGTVLVRRMPPVPPLKIQGLVSLVAAPVLLSASFTTEPHGLETARTAPWGVWAAIGFGAVVSTLFATALLFWLVQRHETGRVTPYMLSTPLITCLIGVGIFHDHLGLRLIAGGALTLVGVTLVALAERRRGNDSLAVVDPV